jgi:cell division transport system permease protein
MRTWVFAHAAALSDALRRLASTPFATLLSVIAIGTALSLPLTLYMVIDQFGGIAKHLSRDPRVSVFLVPDAGADDARSIEQRLKQHDSVASVDFVPRDTALAELERTAGLGDVRATLGQNPLPDAFIVTARGSSPTALEALQKEVSAWPEVEHVQADAQWAQRLQALLRLGRAVALITAVLLGALLAAITFNTIRLQILARKEEIEVSRLIGATKGFVRRPFLYLGLLQGLAGGIAALVIAGGALWALSRELEALAVLYGASFSLTGPGLREAVAALASAALLGAAGAWVSASKYLKNK